MNLGAILGTVAASGLLSVTPPISYTVPLAMRFDTITTEDRHGAELSPSGAVLHIPAPRGPFGGKCMRNAPTPSEGGLLYNGGGNLAPATADFTFEIWVSGDSPLSDGIIFGKWSDTDNSGLRNYCLSYSSGRFYFRLRTSASSTIREAYSASINPSTFWNGSWHHIAIQRRGTTCEVYVDGSSAGGTTYNISTGEIYTGGSYNRYSLGGGGSAASYRAGAWIPGLYFDECRMTVGTCRYSGNFTPPASMYPRGSGDDPLWSQTELLCGFNADFCGVTVRGTAAGAVRQALDINRQSVSNASAFGNITSTGLRSYNQLDSSEGRFSTSGIADLLLGADDFTLDVIVGRTASDNTYTFGTSELGLFSQSALTSYGFVLKPDGGSSTNYGNPDSGGNYGEHYAIARDGNTVRFYHDGAQVGSVNFGGTPLADFSGNWNLKTGLARVALKAFRLTKGSARYTGSTYTVPSADQIIDVS